MPSLTFSRNIDLDLGTRIIRCFSILMYGAESRTLPETMYHRLEAFEMCMSRILWDLRIRNITTQPFILQNCCVTIYIQGLYKHT